MKFRNENTKRWMSLVAMASVLFIFQFSCYITAGLATIMMPQFGLSASQFGIVCNMPYLAGVLFGILTGNLGDKYGIKRVMTVGIVIFIIGAALRSFATGFWSLCITSLFMGIGVAILNANSTKAIRLWFRSDVMNVAMGIYVCGASVGGGIAISIGGYFETIFPAYRLCSILAVLTLFIWLLFYQSHPMEGQKADTVGLIQFKSVLKNRNVWIVSFFALLVFGICMTQLSYISAALYEIGGDAGSTGRIAFISSVSVAIGSVFMPAVITRFKMFRPVMISICVLQGIAISCILLVPFGAFTSVIIVVQGLLFGSMIAMGKTVPALLRDIDAGILGAVGGMQSTLQNLGAWLTAGYIIAPICESLFPNMLYESIYIGAGIFSILAAVCVMLLPKDLPTKVTGSAES